MAEAAEVQDMALPEAGVMARGATCAVPPNGRSKHATSTDPLPPLTMRTCLHSGDLRPKLEAFAAHWNWWLEMP